jgi:hypothetical protein
MKQWQFNQRSIEPKHDILSKKKTLGRRSKRPSVLFATDQQLEPPKSLLEEH